MAAATASSVAAKISQGLDTLKRFVRYTQQNEGPRGIPVPIADKAVVPETSVDDALDIFRLSPKLPAGYLLDFRGTPSDLDSGANLVYDVVWITADGVVSATLTSGSTKGQAASGSDVLAAAATGVYVPEGYLALKVTTGAGAGATAGTYSWYLFYSHGILKPGQEINGPFLRDVTV
jgi:hypothetical protein